MHIAKWFTEINKTKTEWCSDSSSSDEEDDEEDESVHKKLAPTQVLYCGPSNKSVDVVAGWYLAFSLKTFESFSTNINAVAFSV